MTKPLKSFDEAQAEARAKWAKSDYAGRDAQKPRPNGVACPKCGEELWDSDPMVTLTSNPPQKNVHCEACGYRGYMVR